MCFILTSGRENSEKVGRWTHAEGDLLPLPVVGSGVSPRKFFENIGAYRCSLVHFWRPAQQKMYNWVFNLDFGRSMWWPHQKWHGKSTLKNTYISSYCPANYSSQYMILRIVVSDGPHFITWFNIKLSPADCEKWSGRRSVCTRR